MGIRKKDESRITANEMRYILVIASYTRLHHNAMEEVQLGFVIHYMKWNLGKSASHK